jgi:AcrR family transcriptional regulator
MPYRRTDNVIRKANARHDAILAAARAIAAEGGMAAVQIAAVAERAGIAAGTVYRYFSSKTELVAALVDTLVGEELTALRQAADSAPGPLSALAAAMTTFAARSLAERRLAFAMMAEPVEPEIDAARRGYRAAIANELERCIGAALAAGRLPDQDATVAASAIMGALSEGLLGPLVSKPGETAAETRAAVQAITLFALRALGVVDARARGLVVQTRMPTPTLQGQPSP